MVSRTGALVVVALTWSGSAAAQDATGRVEGRVLTPDTRPAAAVRVAASSPSLQLHREVETDARGYFRLGALPVGTYDVRLALVGYRPVKFEGVTVWLGRTTSLGETSLAPQALELGEIVVSAARPLVDVSSAATVTNIPAEQFNTLPTGRNFRSIVTLAPQANLSFFPGDEANVSGGSGPENAYYLDGINITDPKLAATSSNLPYNFVRELQVKTGGYEAEFGRATGGIIDVITHSGGNRLSGQVFGFFTNSGLTGEPRFFVPGTKELAFSEYDAGGSLGGPVVRDRLWFFAAYNPSFHRQRVDVAGPDLPDDRLVQHLFATKLTWRAGPRTDMIVTVHGDPSRHRSFGGALDADSVANPEAVAASTHQGGLVLSALVRQRLGRSTQIEVGMARVTRDDNTEAASAPGRVEPHYVDLTTSVVSGGLGSSTRDHAVRTGLRGSLSAVLGRHTAKVGVEYEDNFLDERNDNSAKPGAPGGSIFRTDDTTWVWSRGLGGGKFHNRIPTVYAQDSWRAGERMTLNAGLRWEGEYLSHAGGQVVQSFTDEWQPRVGFTYQLGELGIQKLSGSFGRFYEQIPLDFATAYDADFGSGALLQFDHDPRLDPSGEDTVLIFGAPGPQSRHYLKGEYFDEFTLGYDRAIGREFRVGLRGTYRTLRWAVEDVFDPATGGESVGNPGRGVFVSAPRARRTYAALVATFEKPGDSRFNFLASYVLSRTRGNYEGLYDAEVGIPRPNDGQAFDSPAQYPNSTGLLPNDRPHVLKLSGSYRFGFGLTTGTAIAWMSGIPRNEFALADFSSGLIFLRPRGSAGRTPAVFDAGLRFTYALPPWAGSSLRPRLYLDMFHLGNRRTTIAFYDLHYQEVDASGNPTNPEPKYRRPFLFQPPMSARLGLSVDFGGSD